MSSADKTAIFLKKRPFRRANAVYAGHFTDAKAPACATAQVARLRRDVLFEVEAIRRPPDPHAGIGVSVALQALANSPSGGLASSLLPL
jgi:hypothetical protein